MAQSEFNPRYICVRYRYDESYGMKDYEPHRCRVNKTGMCGFEGRGFASCPMYVSQATQLTEEFSDTGKQAQRKVEYSIQRNEKEWEPPQ